MTSSNMASPGGLSRRHFLGHMAATSLSVPALQFFNTLRANAADVRKKRRSCIVLWMSGGPSHLDIWDLKPDSEKNGGPFRADRDVGAGRPDQRAPAQVRLSRCTT